MKDGLFEVGDIIKGLKNNGYGVFNENLLKGKVLSTTRDDQLKYKMRVLIANHRVISYEGKIGHVDNDTNKFELVDRTQGDFWESLEVL